MITSNIEIENLIQRHQAILAHMNFLIKALSTLSVQPSQSTTYSTSLRDRIACYRWSLYDFKEAIQRQSELDECILPRNDQPKEILKEYQEIREQIDTAIELIEDAANNKVGQEELIIISRKVNEAVNIICKTLKHYIDEEDNYLKQQQKLDG
jgi:hypothetical protein